MAYRRRYRRRRGYKPRRRKRGGLVRHRKPDAFDYARSAWNATKQIRRLINVETKYFLYTEANIASSISWGIRNLVGVPQGGDTNDRRDGNSIKPLTLTGRVQMEIGSAATAPHEFDMRIILLRGKNEQGDGLTEYLTAYEDGSTAPDIQKFKLDDTRYNSRTLMDKTWHFSRSLTGVASRYERSFMLKLDGHINYPDATTTPEGGGVYALFVWNVANIDIVMNIHSKLTFTDN